MRRVLICGAGGGLGSACVKRFLDLGDSVVATVREVEASQRLLELREQYAQRLTLLALDITSAEGVRDVLGGARANDAPPDVLVNCIGIATPGTVEGDDAYQRQMFEVNFWGPLRLADQVLPVMRARGQGRIVMVSSLSALIGMPCDGIYAASKAALTRAMEALRYEVAPFGVHVSVIVPGKFNTPLLQAMADMPATSGVYASLLDKHRVALGQAVDGGEHPDVFAELVVGVCAEPAPQFQYPAGAQAQAVCASLQGLDEREREALVMANSQAGWWRDR